MATLLATSPPPLNIDSVFAQGHAPPSPAYSSPPHPPSPLSPRLKGKDEHSMTLSAPSNSLHGSSTSSSVPNAASLERNDAFMTSVLRGDEPAPVQPAKDIEEFKRRLPPPVEFIEGSSSGAFAASLEGRYEPINASPKAAPKTLIEPQPKTKQTAAKKASSNQKASQSLYTLPIDLTWPSGYLRGSGLYNTGNTCFLNSALQCLLHTPPLLRVLRMHTGSECRVKSGFCMSCSLRQVMELSFHQKTGPFVPSSITKNLIHIAKHFRRGRQEDAHEFLRYAIDSLQKSCLAGYPPKIDHKLAETTWVHKIFGGRLRSRVTCHQCGYNSDTFDSILDLSIDIYNVGSLKEALKKFTAKDYLKGADKYKCEKCKRPVNAEKQFTIHEAPAVLTVHLKRFTPMGRKLQHPVRYDERLSLQPAMSEGQHGPTYTLYGVISHMGGGPNSGHYFAHVRGADGQWYEMNDDSVERARRPEPLNMKYAYMLFYIRDKGQALEAAVGHPGLANGMAPSKKRKAQSEDEQENEDKPRNGQEAKTARPFIGPVIPLHLLQKSDPQSDMLKRKIEAAEREKPSKVALAQLSRQPLRPRKPLVEYEGDESEEEQGEPVERRPQDSTVTQNNGWLLQNEERRGGSGSIIPSSSPTTSAPEPGSPLRDDRVDNSSPTAQDDAPSPSPSSPTQPPPTSPSATISPAEAISPSNFYGSTSSSKRKSPDGEEKDKDSQRRKNGFPSSSAFPSSFSSTRLGGNPFGKSRIGDTLHRERNRNQEEERELFRPRQVHKKQFGSRKKFAY